MCHYPSEMTSTMSRRNIKVTRLIERITSSIHGCDKEKPFCSISCHNVLNKQQKDGFKKKGK